MKCPQCGAWNKAFLPKCTGCGAPLDNNTHTGASWRTMHKKKPSLTVMQFDDDDANPEILPPDEDAAFDPEALDSAALTDEMEELRQRRKEGARRIRQMKEQTAAIRRSISEAAVLEPVPEPYDVAPERDADRIVIRKRQQLRQERYSQESQSEDLSTSDRGSDRGYFGESEENQVYTYVDDENAPIYYDGYTPDPGDQGALTDDEYMPRRSKSFASAGMCRW